ncbi:MAG: ABC transporter substrate-binding protein, partial [Pseudomonadales bacterium]
MKMFVLIGLLAASAGCGVGDQNSLAPAATEAPAATIESAAPEVFRWKMITTWPKNLPGPGTGAERLAELLRTMSNGRLDIKVYGAGELVGAFEVFDAVAEGSAEMGHG